MCSSLTQRHAPASESCPQAVFCLEYPSTKCFHFRGLSFGDVLVARTILRAPSPRSSSLTHSLSLETEFSHPQLALKLLTGKLAEDGLELLTLLLPPPSAGIACRCIPVSPPSCFMHHWGLTPGLPTCKASTLPSHILGGLSSSMASQHLNYYFLI